MSENVATTEPPKKAPRGRPRSVETRRRILIAAAAVIKERGFADVRVSDIAEAAGTSTGLVIYHFKTLDAVLIEGFPAEVPLDGEYAEELRGLPLLMIHGTADTDYPIDGARAQFAKAAAPKWFMTLEGGDHSEDYRMGPLAIAAADAALHFFDLTLQGDDAAADRLARTPGVESVQE